MSGRVSDSAGASAEQGRGVDRSVIRMFLLYVLVIGLLGATVPRAFRSAEALLTSAVTADYPIFVRAAARHVNGGPLYQTSRPDFWFPGSAVYKYPPVFAAAIKLVALDDPEASARALASLELAMLAVCLVLILLTLRPTLLRSLICILIWVNWIPFWGTLYGLQLDIPILLLFTVALIALVRNRDWLAGGTIGLAAALKLYPAPLGVYFLLTRRWKALAGATAVGVISLLLADWALGAPLSFQFVFELLPKLGGTALGYENLSLPGVLSRLTLFAVGDSELVWQELQNETNLTGTFETLAPSRVVLMARIVIGLSFLTLVAVSTVAVRRADRTKRSTRVAVSWSLAICLLVLFIPTSWTDYHTVLGLPLMCAVALGPQPKGNAVFWLLLCAAVVLGTASHGTGDLLMVDVLQHRGVDIPVLKWTGSLYGAAYPVANNLVIAALPLLLWAALLRLLRAEPPEGTS